MKKKSFVKYLFAAALLTAGCAGTGSENTIPAEIDYDTAVVSYLGPEGTYTQEACGQFFEKKGSYLPYATVQEAVEALIRKETVYAVIPQENTIGGAIIDYLDTLLAEDQISIVGEVELPISQNLLVLPGTALSDIRTVCSHKQGLAQAKDWLKENLPDAEVIEVSSTAEGARLVSEGQNSSCAAVASAACADVYSLEILAAAIQNNDSNKTRFYVLSLQEPATAAAERLVFVAMGKAEDLPALMSEMEKQNMTLITIHDRPLKTELGQYYYLIECADGNYDKYLKVSKNNPFTFRYLGSFDVH